MLDPNANEWWMTAGPSFIERKLRNAQASSSRSNMRMKPSGATLISLLSFHCLGIMLISTLASGLDQKIMKRKEEQERYLLISYPHGYCLLSSFRRLYLSVQCFYLHKNDVSSIFILLDRHSSCWPFRNSSLIVFSFLFLSRVPESQDKTLLSRDGRYFQEITLPSLSSLLILDRS